MGVVEELGGGGGGVGGRGGRGCVSLWKGNEGWISHRRVEGKEIEQSSGGLQEEIESTNPYKDRT